jgi:hypothetical protein
MSNSQISALRNMPIWIDRCDVRVRNIMHVRGRHTSDSKQIEILRDYMRLVVCQNG